MLFPVLLVCLVLFVVLPVIGAALSTLVTTVLFGLVVGYLGRLAAPGRARGGLLFTLAVGVAGSLTGSLVAEGLRTGTIGRLVLQVASAALLVAVLSRPRVRA